MAARLKVTQIKSKISEKQDQRDTLRSLGCTASATWWCARTTPRTGAMSATVAHLVKVEEID